MWALWASQCSRHEHFYSLQGKLCDTGQTIDSPLSSTPNQSISFQRKWQIGVNIHRSKPSPADTDQNNFKASMLRAQVFYETDSGQHQGLRGEVGSEHTRGDETGKAVHGNTAQKGDTGKTQITPKHFHRQRGKFSSFCASKTETFCMSFPLHWLMETYEPHCQSTPHPLPCTPTLKLS